MDARVFPTPPASKHLADVYLLGLAVKHGGCFATFDLSIDASLIPGGPQAFYLILPSDDFACLHRESRGLAGISAWMAAGWGKPAGGFMGLANAN